MTSRRRARHGLPLAAVLTLLVLSGCSGHTQPTTTGSAPTGASPPATTTATGPAGVLPTAPTGPVTAEPTGLPSPAPPCRDIATNLLGDGTWTGPVTAQVHARSGHASFTSSRGTGAMTLVVRAGRILSGAWQLRWSSAGDADNGQARAHLSLTGRISGTVSGAATGPVAAGAWTLHGTATVTEPVHTSGPIEESGRVVQPVTIASATCGGVPAPRATGSYRITILSKEAEATFTLKARWTASRGS